MTHLRTVHRFKVPWYLDDFLLAPGRIGMPAKAKDFLGASKIVDVFFLRPGLGIHLLKGVWGEGTQELEHLGFLISTPDTSFTVTAAKQTKIRRMAGKLLCQANQGRGSVSADLPTSFCGTAVSFSLAVSLTRFNTRSLYDALT